MKEKKEQLIQARVSNRELLKVMDHCRAKGITVSEWIRSKIKGIK